jgi:hypothetical protein
MNGALLRDMGGTLVSGPGGITAEPRLVSEADLRRQAERIGGLTFVSSAPITTASGFTGVKAVFAFRDISSLRFPSDVLIPSALEAGQGPTSQERSVTFTFSSTDVGSSLTIRTPGAGKAPSTGATHPAPPNPDPLAVLKPVSSGMRLSFVVEVAGTIIRSNSDNVDGARVTVFAFDFDELMKDEAKLVEISRKTAGSSPSFAEMKSLLKGIRGVQISDPIVNVEFR